MNVRIKQVNAHKRYRIVLASRKCLINISSCHFTAVMLVVLCHYLSKSKYVDIEIRGQMTEKLFLCIPMWVSVRVCLHASVCVCFFVSVTMTVYAGQRSTLGVVPQRSFTLLFETGYLFDLSSLCHLDWVAYKHRTQPVSASPNLELQVWASTPGIFLWVLEIKHQSSCLWGKQFPEWDIFPTPKYF